MFDLSPEQTILNNSLNLVICTYNNAPLLERTLEAISRQRVARSVEWSVLVVDNNSSDETPRVVDRYMESGSIPYLSYIHEPKQGLNYARLCGIKNTDGKWIAFIDDDCLLEEDWVARAADFAAAHPACGAFGGRVILDWEKPPRNFVLNYGFSFAQQDFGSEVMQPDCLVGAGLVVNREAINKTNWLDKQFLRDREGQKLVSGGDVEIVLRIRSAGYEIWYNPACKLRHFIPARRVEQRYLVDINYGLGICQLHADGLVWEGGYPSFVLTSVLTTLRSSLYVFKRFVRAAVGSRRPDDLAETGVMWAFQRGRWAGIYRIHRTGSRYRRSLLGTAILPKKNPRTK